MKLPPSSPLKRSFWMQQAAPAAAPASPLTGEITADIAIIGGGFVGLWTALTLKEHAPDCRVVILEQDICGGGASGRNGGLVMSWWPKIQSLMSFCHPEQALFLGRSAEGAIGELGEFCRRHGIEAAFHQGGWLWTATCDAHVDVWESTLRACERLGVTPFERLSRQEVAARTGSERHIAGVYESSNATVQPAALARGMRRVAMEAGVEIFEGSGVEEITPGARVRLRTAQGRVHADRVVLATNAWSSAIPELRKKIAVVGSSIVVTAPIPQELSNLGWQGGEAVTDSQLLVNYCRTTQDARIAFGKGTGSLSMNSRVNATFSEHQKEFPLVTNDLKYNFPSLSNPPVVDGWSGPIDRTYDSLPIFGHLKGCDNIYYGIGWSGNGVGPSRIGGRILASLALGRDDAWANCGLVERPSRAFPPEPFRFLGGSLVRQAVLRKDQAELRGTPPARVDKFLSGFAPAGLEDK